MPSAGTTQTAAYPATVIPSAQCLHSAILSEAGAAVALALPAGGVMSVPQGQGAQPARPAAAIPLAHWGVPAPGVDSVTADQEWVGCHVTPACLATSGLARWGVGHVIAIPWGRMIRSAMTSGSVLAERGWRVRSVICAQWDIATCLTVDAFSATVRVLA